MKPDNLTSAAAANAAGGKVTVGCCGTQSQGKRLTLSLEASQLNGIIVLHCEGQVIFRNEVRALAT